MGIVYKILCNETGECYVGSANTKRCLISRKSAHRNIYNSECSSKQIIERGNYEFSIVEENIFIDIELRQREQYWIDTSDNVINERKAYTTPEQKKEYLKIYCKKRHKEIYEGEYKETILLKNKEYRDKNKEQIYKKQNEKFTCECGGKYSRVNKVRHTKSIKHLNYLNKFLC